MWSHESHGSIGTNINNLFNVHSKMGQNTQFYFTREIADLLEKYPGLFDVQEIDKAASLLKGTYYGEPSYSITDELNRRQKDHEIENEKKETNIMQTEEYISHLYKNEIEKQKRELQALQKEQQQQIREEQKRSLKHRRSLYNKSRRGKGRHRIGTVKNLMSFGQSLVNNTRSLFDGNTLQHLLNTGKYYLVRESENKKVLNQYYNKQDLKTTPNMHEKLVYKTTSGKYKSGDLLHMYNNTNYGENIYVLKAIDE
jgi:hypothetical protein